MCGIAGIIQLNGDLESLKRINEMTARVAHRGPDGQGVVTVGNVALGHRRLAIIDLSDHGAQPMRAIGGKLYVTFNGEIYNFVELREELSKKGYEFFGSSDTEVLLNAYRHWGKKCVDHLNGMWSFAILDVAKGVVFCSRDRFGEKPFYYHRASSAFAFGSEIRQLIPELHEVVANKSLMHRFLTGIAGEDFSQTFFCEINKLPAGHNLTFTLATNQINIECYYELKEQNSLMSLGFDKMEKRFFSLFQDSVKLRLRSDVIVGMCLSGGLDSSSVATVAAEQTANIFSRPLKAITAASTELSRDETSFARAVVEASKLDWHVTKPDYKRFKSAIGEVVRAQEEPFGSASIVMQFEVMRVAAKNRVKVLLDGQGADEVLLGYERYFAAYLQQALHQDGVRYLFQQAKQISKNNDSVSLVTLVQYYTYFNYAIVRKLKLWLKFGFSHLKSLLTRDIGSYAGKSKNIFDLQKFELTQSNLPPLLRFEDKNAMWHSVETRLPFLDHRLVEYCCNLPMRAKIKDGWTKFILRSCMKNRLPREVIWRTNKFGFEGPQSDWVSNHKSEMLAAINRSQILKTFYKNDAQKKRALRKKDLLWKLYIVALWEREFGVSGLK